MRHKVHKHSFGRKTGPRTALMRGLVDSLVKHERIRTTLPKAKELRRFVERAITTGKKGTVHARRTLESRYPNNETVKTVFDNLAVRFKDRSGGYTRIIKLGPRPGDNADMAYIEFVDYVLPEAAGDETVSGDAEKVAQEKLHQKRVQKHRRSVRKMQNKSRQVNRK